MKASYHIDCTCEHEAPLAKSNSSFGKCNIILTKSPSSIGGLELIQRLSKDLFIICIIRDPRDMVVSKHGRFPDTYYCGLNYWIKFVKDFRKIKDLSRFILIKYEDFTSNPDEIQDYIESRITFLKRKNKFSEYHLVAYPSKDSLLALNSLRPIESEGVGSWKKHMDRLKQQFNKYGDITESLIQFNYEINSDWTALLHDVDSGNFDTYKSEVPLRTYLSEIVLTVFNNIMERMNVNPDKFSRPIKLFFRGLKMINGK